MPSPHASGTAGDRARAGYPLPVSDATSFSLSPLLNNLPSITGISEMSGINRFLPAKGSERADVSVSAVWYNADLDGSGIARVLLLTSPIHALQVYAFRDGVIPDDPHVKEKFPTPEEVASIPSLVYDYGVKRSALKGCPVRKEGDEIVISAHLLHPALARDAPLVALITRTESSKSSSGYLALVVVNLSYGKATRRIDLGKGHVASVSSSSCGIVISLSTAIHILDPDFEPLTALTDLPNDSTSRLPLISLSGRLLAYTTDETAAIPGREGLGSIVVASARPKPSNHSSPAAIASPQTTQGAILSSAVEIGGGVARGVWAGVKMGVRAANDARNSRIARSAPSERSMLESSTSSVVTGTDTTSESRSVEEGPSGSSIPSPSRGVWVKIVDLASPNLRLIAHFRLPPSRHLVPQLSPGSQGGIASDQPVTFLSFSPQGSRLLVATGDGRAFHVLDVRPHGAESSKGTRGEVWNQYVLRRGNTPATVSSVNWSKDERWIAVGTGRGTIHVFAISPGGSKPSPASHIPLRIGNAQSLQPLGLELSPVARLRPSATLPDSSVDSAEAEARIQSLAFATFAATRRHPSRKDVLCQDVLVYRSGLGQLDLVRLNVKASASTLAPPETGRRGSNLTEMLREKSGMISETGLDVETLLKARWALPMGRGPADSPQTVKRRAKPSAENGRRPSTISSKALAHAEIRTHSTSPRILPSSIYLCHQAEFYAAVPTDEYQPLSVLDKVARTKRLVYRQEVQMTPPADPQSFDEPLSSALHSVLDSKPAPQLPRLPNGSPAKSPWGSIPVRHIAQNLGEGVDRVRREYARAQRKRQSAISNGTPLSFEEDTVFASADDDDVSPPSSGPLPPTIDDDWSEKWEDEYRRAVEDDGGPDDLVLGLLDEEEEERREKKVVEEPGKGGGKGGKKKKVRSR